MARAALQVLVLPYRILLSGEVASEAKRIECALFSRADYPCWQFIAGGAEEQELPLDAARREAYEPAGIAQTCEYIALDSKASLPVHYFAESRNWGESIFVVPEYSFGVAAK